MSATTRPRTVQSIAQVLGHPADTENGILFEKRFVSVSTELIPKFLRFAFAGPCHLRYRSARALALGTGRLHPACPTADQVFRNIFLGVARERTSDCIGTFCSRKFQVVGARVSVAADISLQQPQSRRRRATGRKARRPSAQAEHSERRTARPAAAVRRHPGRSGESRPRPRSPWTARSAGVPVRAGRNRDRTSPASVAAIEKRRGLAELAVSHCRRTEVACHGGSLPAATILAFEPCLCPIR